MHFQSMVIFLYFRIDKFGAVFIPAMCKPDDAQLYCSRPGFRIWKASIDGTVNNTFMFKDLLSQPHKELPVGAFVVTSIEKGVPATQFGPLLLLNKNLLVTWNESCLYVLNPESSSIVGTQKCIGKIKSVVTTGNEIFLLRRNTNRELIRISTDPLPQAGSKSKLKISSGYLPPFCLILFMSPPCRRDILFFP